VRVLRADPRSQCTLELLGRPPPAAGGVEAVAHQHATVQHGQDLGAFLFP